MTNKYLLTAATLAGVAAGSIGTASLTAVAAVATEKRVEASETYTHGQLASATNLQVANQACAQFDADLELSGGDACTIDDLLGWCVQLNTPSANQATVRYRAKFDGTWVPGAAQ